MHLNRCVWGLPFKRPSTASAKAVYSLLEESIQRKQNKTFALGSQILLPEHFCLNDCHENFDIFDKKEWTFSCYLSNMLQY